MLIGERAVASPGGCMWVHMHPVHIPVHPLNYSFNVYQVLAVNSLYALFSIYYTQSQLTLIHSHVHVHVVCVVCMH